MSISNEQVVAFIKKNPIGVGCGLLSLALAAAIYFRTDLVPAAQKELDEKGTLSDRLSANLKFGKDLPEQLQQFNDDIKAIDSRLVHVGDRLSNDQYFYSLDQVPGVKIGFTQLTTNSVQAGALMKATKANFVPIGFQLNVTGTYTQLLDVLSRLENGLPFCRVLSAGCKKTTGPAVTNGDDLLLLNLNIELLGLP